MINNIYNQRITILNKKDKKDLTTKKDIWKKTVLNNVAVYKNSDRGVYLNNIVISEYYLVLIPFNDNFKEYSIWKKDMKGYSISNGDYIVIGDINETIDSDNIVSVLSNYPNKCVVKHFEILPKRFGASVQLKIEGV